MLSGSVAIELAKPANLRSRTPSDAILLAAGICVCAGCGVAEVVVGADCGGDEHFVGSSPLPESCVEGV